MGKSTINGHGFQFAIQLAYQVGFASCVAVPGKNGSSFAVLSWSHGPGTRVALANRDPRHLPQSTDSIQSEKGNLLAESKNRFDSLKIWRQ